MEPTFDNQTEILWEEFEKTGSVEAFLRYARSLETGEVPELVKNPT